MPFLHSFRFALVWFLIRSHPPPPPCESNTLVKAMADVVAATFGTVSYFALYVSVSE